MPSAWRSVWLRIMIGQPGSRFNSEQRLRNAEPNSACRQAVAKACPDVAAEEGPNGIAPALAVLSGRIHGLTRRSSLLNRTSKRSQASTSLAATMKSFPSRNGAHSRTALPAWRSAGLAARRRAVRGVNWGGVEREGKG